MLISVTSPVVTRGHGHGRARPAGSAKTAAVALPVALGRPPIGPCSQGRGAPGGEETGPLGMTRKWGSPTMDLVGGDWNMNFIFPYLGNFIIPTDELLFFRGVGIPPTLDGF